MAERKRRSASTTAAAKKRSAAGSTGKSAARRGKKSGTPWLKYEILGLVFLVAGIFLTVGMVGVDTGQIGYALDDVFAYIFGTGRLVVAVALIIAGLQYIVKRKALPFTGNWVMGALSCELVLSLWHLLFTGEGEEFLPGSLRLGGGFFGAVPASFLRGSLGSFGAVLVLFGALVIVLMIWKKVSISKPVAFAQEVTTEEVARISGKAVTGIQTASQAVQNSWQQRKERKIFDIEREGSALDNSPDGTVMSAVSEVSSADELSFDSPARTLRGDEAAGIAAGNSRNTGYGTADYAAAADEGIGAERDDRGYEPEECFADEEEAPETADYDGNGIVEAVVDRTKPAAYTAVPPRDPAVPPLLEGLKPLESELTAGTAEVGPAGQTAVPTAAGEKTYRLPSVSFLHRGSSHEAGLSDEVRQNARILQDTLKSFNIDAKMLTASRGPAVTRYELEPAAGVKVSKIVHLADDLALKLAATGIRIEAPIPGKAAVGIEVPNKKVTPVCLRDVLDTEVFRNAAGGVPVGLGKDIAGTPVVADLTKMPHMLVAGSTGSGKSVCINTLISSILFKQRPEDVKLILIDPKVVELSNYNGIPHLMTPVVTDPKKAANILRWVVREMDDRYKRFALTKTRDIKRYNELRPQEAMPYVVIIIDELADLMMAAAGDVEDSICRLAQKARACGMHLVLATQRPSVDVITGLIKANVPSRIAFAVSSQIDSRTILDMAGAEKLIGKGDMLFYPMGASKPVRVQGAFISDGEIDEVVAYIKAQGKPQYNEAVEAAQREDSHNEGGRNFFEDELMDKAIMMVMETGQASVSLLQRRFRIGFSRAARMVDTMEEMGIVGPSNGSKARDILMTPDQVQAKYFSH